MRGNQHGLHCPKCLSDEEIYITVTMKVEGLLMSDGVDHDVTGDFEWEDSDPACCGECGWTGQVKDLTYIEGTESDGFDIEDLPEEGDWNFTMTSDVYGKEYFGPYDSAEKAMAGIKRVKAKAAELNDGIKRYFTILPPGKNDEDED